MTVAQGTLIERLEDAANEYADMSDVYEFQDTHGILLEAAAELRTLSAQVVELQQQVAALHLLRGRQIVHSTVTRASVPPSVKDSGT